MYIPEQMGMRNPIFATSLGLIKYVGEQDAIYQVAKNRVVQRPAAQPQQVKQNVVSMQQKEAPVYSEPPVEEEYNYEEESKKDSIVNQFKQFINSIFE